MPTTTQEHRGGPAARPRPRPGPRSWPALLVWALYALVLLLCATYPWLDRLVRDAGRPDLALLAPFVVAPSLAALTGVVMLATGVLVVVGDLALAGWAMR